MFALIFDERWAEDSAAWSHLRACRCFLSSSNLVFTLPVMKRMTVSGGSVLLLSGRSVCSIVLMVARTTHNLVRWTIATRKSPMATEGRRRLDIFFSLGGVSSGRCIASMVYPVSWCYCSVMKNFTRRSVVTSVGPAFLESWLWSRWPPPKSRRKKILHSPQQILLDPGLLPQPF